jgi:hypothetical protein
MKMTDKDNPLLVTPHSAEPVPNVAEAKAPSVDVDVVAKVKKEKTPSVYKDVVIVRTFQPGIGSKPMLKIKTESPPKSGQTIKILTPRKITYRGTVDTCEVVNGVAMVTLKTGLETA